MDPNEINPELRKQLTEAPASKPLEATFTLDPGPGQKYIPEDQVHAKVKEIVQKVSREIGEAHEVVNVFDQIGSFVVRARPAFLKALIECPEVTAAMANQQSEELLIRPVRKGP